VIKRILLVNDDGVSSSGLIALKRGLAGLGKISVVAPREETSGVGKAITSSRVVQVEKIQLSDGSKAWAIDGTPADAYLLAVNKLLKRIPDLVVTGINLGPNLGIDDFLNSGTIGAALEAAIHGVPAIAVSYCKREISDQAEDKRKITGRELEVTAQVACKVAEQVLHTGLPASVDLLSINVPEHADRRKVKVTSLSYVGYGNLFSKEKNGYRIASWKLSDYVATGLETDVQAVKVDGCISVTPVGITLRHNKKALKRMISAVALAH
jgi:5'-nucleotidase